MKKSPVVALFLAIMMMATAAFATTGDQIVAKVGDVEIPLSEAQAMFDDYYNQYNEMYKSYGMAFSLEDAEYLRTAIVDMLAQTAVLDAKVAEYGLGDITEEDKTELRQKVETDFEAELVAYAESLGVTVEEARAQVASEGITIDSIYEQNLADLPYSRLYEQVVADVAVTDDEVKAEYQAYVDEDKGLYAEDIASYEMTTMYYGSSDIFYVPEGFRTVKHILLATPDDVSSELMDIETDMNAVKNDIDALTDELYALENVTEESETEARTQEEIQADLDALQPQYDELQAKYDEVEAQILPSLQPIIDEINTKLAGGTSFEDLIAEYNTDPGMESNPDGYMVHKDSVMWETSFRDAAMALAKVGDVSEPVSTAYGIHIIQYVADVPGGAVELTDEVAAELKESLLYTKQNEKYMADFDAWLVEANVETHPELVVLPEIAAEDALVETEVTPEAPAAEDEATEETEGDKNADGSVG